MLQFSNQKNYALEIKIKNQSFLLYHPISPMCEYLISEIEAGKNSIDGIKLYFLNSLAETADEVIVESKEGFLSITHGDEGQIYKNILFLDFLKNLLSFLKENLAEWVAPINYYRIKEKMSKEENEAYLLQFEPAKSELSSKITELLLNL